MNEFLQSIGIAPGSLPAILAVSATVTFLLYKRFIVNIFDPLLLLVIGMTADTVLVYALPWEPSLKWEYAIFSLFLWFGFRVSARSPRSMKPTPVETGELYDLEAVLHLLLIIIILANLYLGIAAGFPLLSARPSSAKVMVNSGGIGLVRRINMGPLIFFLSGCFYLIFQRRRRRRAATMLAVCAVFMSLSGSKGALLPFVYAPALMLAHKGFLASRSFDRRTKRFMAYGLVGGVAIGLAVTIKDSGSLTAGFAALAQRILLTGDVVLYYFAGRQRVIEITTRSLAGYLSYLTNDSLAMLRLAEYREPLGSVILGTGNNGFGPNAQYFVRADLFFGPIWGCLYSMIIGYGIGKFRTMFFTASPSYPMIFVFTLSLALLSPNLVSESSMFVQAVVSIVLTVLPLWAAVCSIRKSQELSARYPVPSQ